MVPVSVPFSPEVLEEAIRTVLSTAGVHDIAAYGWSGPDEVDPEFAGHAMWQTDQPTIDFQALFGESQVHRRPDSLQESTLTLGEDFCALMQASRLSIGLMLLWKPQALQSLLMEPSFFWLHHMDAHIKLAIASDRLRDLLIVACTADDPSAYRSGSRRNGKYVTPFNEAMGLLTRRGIDATPSAESLAALPALAESIYPYIKRRNAIVHEVATQIARASRGAVKKLQRQYDDQQTQGFTPREFSAQSLEDAIAAEAERRRDVERDVDDVIAWYQLLIRASNHIFQVEYWARRGSGASV